MNKQEQPTCGKGLAENSVLPAKVGELIAAMAENLEAHRKALDLKDVNSNQESEPINIWLNNYESCRNLTAINC